MILDYTFPWKRDSDDCRSPVDQPAVVNIGGVNQGKLVGGLGFIDWPVRGAGR